MSWNGAIDVLIKGYQYSNNQISKQEVLNSIVDYLREGRKNSNQITKSVLNNKDEEAPIGTPRDLICCICSKNKRKVLFFPCKHAVCCITCSQSIKKYNGNLCPICQSIINKKISYYST